MLWLVAVDAMDILVVDLCGGFPAAPPCEAAISQFIDQLRLALFDFFDFFDCAFDSTVSSKRR